MRCRGDSVMSLDGQLLSQKPHSMQRSTRGDALGDGLRNLTCALGSCVVRAISCVSTSTHALNTS